MPYTHRFFFLLPLRLLESSLLCSRIEKCVFLCIIWQQQQQRAKKMGRRVRIFDGIGFWVWSFTFHSFYVIQHIYLVDGFTACHTFMHTMCFARFIIQTVYCVAKVKFSCLLLLFWLFVSRDSFVFLTLNDSSFSPPSKCDIHMKCENGVKRANKKLVYSLS